MCFNEYSNGVYIFYNGAQVGSIRLNTELYDDAQWHVVEMTVAPSETGGARITLSFDRLFVQ